MFDTVLVANRGEIAVRVIRTLTTMGIRSVAVFSDADADAVHVAAADDAVRLGPAAPTGSYLHVERILDAAARTGAQAIHPGYGFLAENPAFARACGDAGLAFVGPPADAIEAMGDKIRAKQLVEGAGVPVVPGEHRPGLSDADLLAAAERVGYPVLVKAAAGGGGKGMQAASDADELAAALAGARRVARGAFGDDALLLEKLVERPRHVEVQVLADTYGRVAAVGDRECSLQRRHQKIVEEAPAPRLPDDTRARMAAAGVAAAKSCGYTSAGTIEFLATPDGDEFFFLEMNTRLQVEHPVTEAVTGIDLVEWQLRLAAGEALTLDEVPVNGHAVEARLYAEDPARGFLPTGGRVLAWHPPRGVGVRVDAGIAEGSVVTGDYDPLLAKVVAWGPDRPTALRRLDGALADTAVLGVGTNAAFLRDLLADDAVVAGHLDTGLVERRGWARGGTPDEVVAAAALARMLALEPAPRQVADPFDLPGGWRVGAPAPTVWRLHPLTGEPVVVRIRGRASQARVAVGDAEPRPASARFADDGILDLVWVGRRLRFHHAQDADVAWLARGGETWTFREQARLEAARHTDDGGPAGPLVAPMPGTVAAVAVSEGDTVAAGQTLLVVEAMKMEHAIVAPVDGVVTMLTATPGQTVGMEEPLAIVEPAGEPRAAAGPAREPRSVVAPARDDPGDDAGESP